MTLTPDQRAERIMHCIEDTEKRAQIGEANINSWLRMQIAMEIRFAVMECMEDTAVEASKYFKQRATDYGRNSRG